MVGLTPEHIEELAKSGITADQAEAEGWYSELSSAAIGSILNWQGAAPDHMRPALIFPFRDPDGKSNGYRRVKPLKPREKDGKPIKYESPLNLPNRAFFPSGVISTLDNADIPLLITEGEKKALCATLRGFHCVGLVGVWGWKVPKSKSAEDLLIADLQAVAWRDRVVNIAFDSDVVTKSEVLQAEERLGQILATAGASVRALRIPEGSK